MRTLIGTFALVLMLALVPGTLDGQALPTASGPGSYIAVGGGASVFEADYGQRYIGGGFVYVDVHPTWRYGIESEVRYLQIHTSQRVTEDTYLIGLKIAFRPSHIRPYAKFLVGAGHINLPYGYAEGTFLNFTPGGGVDYSLGKRLTARLVDVEYQLWPQFPYGQLKPYGISFGISYRLNAMEEFPKNGRRVRK